MEFSNTRTSRQRPGNGSNAIFLVCVRSHDTLRKLREDPMFAIRQEEQRQQESGAPRARRVWIDVLSEAADEASHAEESDGDEQSSGENEPPREQRKAGSRTARRS